MELDRLGANSPASKEPLFDCPDCETKLDRENGFLACPECGWVPKHGSD
ncbi:hypothetical protein [Halostella litorea]|nr:hypothetical protein [Halostella litorea]